LRVLTFIKKHDDNDDDDEDDNDDQWRRQLWGTVARAPHLNL